MTIKMTNVTVLNGGGDAVRIVGDPSFELSGLLANGNAGHGVHVITEAQNLALEFVGDIKYGMSEATAREKYGPKLSAHGFDLDKSLSTAGNLASVGSLALAFFGLS